MSRFDGRDGLADQLELEAGCAAASFLSTLRHTEAPYKEPIQNKYTYLPTYIPSTYMFTKILSKFLKIGAGISTDPIPRSPSRHGHLKIRY